MSKHNCVELELEDELQRCIAQLIPFDKVFDEDSLEAHREQASILKAEIENLEIQLVAFICDPVGKTDQEYDARYVQLTEKLQLFRNRLKVAEDMVHTLMLERSCTHGIWKERYMTKTEQIADITTKLNKIRDVKAILDNASKTSSRPRHNLILMMQLHSHVNFLLKLHGIRKENTPFAAFRSAHNHGLIKDQVFQALMR